MAKPKPNLNWVGHTIGGRYKIEQFLDQGGMSAVYKASDPNLQRTVALKIIHPHLSNDPEFVRRFEQEAAAVAQLRHPNIIQVYDFNHDQDTYYIVLEYAPGQTLKERLKTLSAANGRLPIPDAIRIMTEISDAVAYAHEKGMIHRDLKPANVMLSPKGQAILMDFGVAKMLDGIDHTATGTIVGTAKYMSPEQARGERPDERSDIYSLGIMLYETVAGRPPFDADTTVAILMKHVNEPVPDIRQLHADVPNELVEIIDKALAKNRNERYQSAAHMAAALKLINRLGQTTTPATDAQKTVSSKKRQSTEPSSQEPAPASSQATPAPSDAQPAQAANKSIFLLIGAAALVLIFIIGLGGFFIISQLTRSDNKGEAVAQAVDPNLPSSEGMVKIEGNTYPVGLNNAGNDYAPEQQIELAEYWIDQHEVTNAEYAEFLADTGGQPPADWPQGNVPDEQENHPVKGVTWEQANAYCEWAKKRLPTEAEWEVAARGSEGRLYPWGDKQQAVSLPRSGTYAVGSKTTNQSPFGVFDMAGNVWEWVGEPYASIPEGHKVLRGGANDFLKDMAYRLHGDPNIPTMHASAGMRCAASKVNVIERQSIAENVFYQDSFADPGSGWPIQSEGTFYYGYHPPDFFHVEVGTPENFTSISRQPDFEDITVEAEILVDHTNTEDGDFRYGLALRRKSPNQFYAFTVSSRAGMWYVLKSSPSGLETLAQGQVDSLRGFAPQGFTPDETDSLRVDASGSNFIFHINGKAVAQVSDSEYDSGEIGFFVETFDETLAHVHFDTLTIRELEFDAEQVASNVLYKDEFTDPSSGWPNEDVAGEPFRVGYHPPDFYHVEPRAANETTVVSEGQEFKDVTVESLAFVDHTETENGDFRYGLVVRRTAEEQFYTFTVSPRSGTWYVLKSSPSGLETLAEGSVDTLRGFAPAGFTPDKRDKLRVDAQGSTFAFHINDDPIVQVSDPDYASGEIGFYVENFDETLTHIHYESLTVQEVEAEAIAQAPTVTPRPATPTPTAELVPTATPTPSPPEGMTLIPAGYFQMGSSTGQTLERPEHPVFLDAFYIDTYEVTNAQYRECVQDGDCTQISAQSATRQNYRDDPAYDDYPVVNVTWDQANAYCQWAGKHLPSEAQWEYAASGPENLTWPWGNSFEANRLPANEPDTQPVGSYPEGASPFGVFDMAGNVAEWIADAFAEDFYSNSPPTNPISTDVSAGRIYRGGSFGNTDGQFYTTSRRYGNIRTFSEVDIGFRCALEAPNVTPPEERAELVAEFCELYDTYNPDALCP